MNSNYKTKILIRKMDLKIGKYCEFLKDSFENNQQVIQAILIKEKINNLLKLKRMLIKQIPTHKEIEEVLTLINNNFKMYADNNKSNSYGNLNGVQNNILNENAKQMKKLKKLINENLFADKYVKVLIQLSDLEKKFMYLTSLFFAECERYESAINKVKQTLKETNVIKPLLYKNNKYYLMKQKFQNEKEEIEKDL